MSLPISPSKTLSENAIKFKTMFVDKKPRKGLQTKKSLDEEVNREDDELLVGLDEIPTYQLHQ